MNWDIDYYPLLESMLERLQDTEHGPGITAADIFLDRIQKSKMSPEEKAKEAAEAAGAALVFLAGSTLIMSHEREQALRAFHTITHAVSDWGREQNRIYLNSILGYAEEIAEKREDEPGIEKRFKQAVGHLETGAIGTGPEIASRIAALKIQAERPVETRRGRAAALTEG